MGNAIKKQNAVSAGTADFSERVLEMAVGRFYRASRTHVRRIEALSPKSFRVTFAFAPQERSLNPPPYATASQMTEGLLEAISCSIAAAALSGEEPFSLIRDNLYKFLREVFLLAQETSYAALIGVGEEAVLDLAIEKVSLVRLEHSLYLTEFSYDGFLSGQCTAAVDAAVVRNLIGRDLTDNVVSIRPQN